MQHIAFIGLGNMGAPMAHNLLRADYRLSVLDLSAPTMAALANAGARAASSVADAVKSVDVVISMLPASSHVQELYLAKEGVLDSARPGTLLIDCSTIAFDAAKALASSAASRGFAMLDAPVSGGTGGAQAGSLTFIVGGEAEALERARGLLLAMGKHIFHADSAGSGQVAKICNNMLLGILMAGTAEALNLGVAHGLDPAVLSDIMSKSSGRNWALEVYNPWPGVMPAAPAARGYSGGFGTALMHKDLGLAQQAAHASQSMTPLGSLVHQLFRLHQQQGHGQLDFSSILDLLRAGSAERN